MADNPEIRTVALICPDCSARLRSAPGDVAMFCDECSRACEVRGTGLVHVDLVTLAPLAGFPARVEDALVRLPVWCFGVHVDFVGNDNEALEALGRVARLERVFVPAYRQRNVMAFGDMGMLLTMRPPDLVSTEPRRFSGATLESGEAARLVVPMVLCRADQIHDVTDIDVRVRIRDVTLVTVPARDLGSKIEDLILGREWPLASFMEPEAIRFDP